MSTTSNGTVPLSAPCLRGNEWQYVKECIDTGWVSSAGSFVNRFEKELAARVGAKHAVATVNGTAALHVALRVSGVEPDDEVLVSTLTFIAPVNAIRYLGAWPVLMDADPVYWQMDVEKVATFLNSQCRWQNGQLVNRKSGRRVRALLPVHILGHAVDMDPLLELARKYQLAVIEDATESLGAFYKDRPLGHIGNLGCFSFNGNKIVTTGGGGMITTDDDRLAERSRYLTTQAKDDPVEYVHQDIGYNYRLTNVQAALGVAQMEQLDAFVDAKIRIARHYHSRLAGVKGIRVPDQADWARSTYWLYTVLVDPVQFGNDSRALMRVLKQRGIESRPLWRPAHLQQPYQFAEAFRIEVADRLYEMALSLPSSVQLDEGALERVCQAVVSAARF